MNKTMLALAAWILALAGAPLAQAATYSPANTTVNFQGALTVNSIPCLVSLNMVINAAGNAAVITGGSLTPGNRLCSLAALSFSPNWAVAVTATTASFVATDLSIADVTLMNMLSTCNGPIAVQWNDATDTITVPLQSIGGSSCLISGTLGASTNVAITNP